MSERIAVFGGTFDPPTHGHLDVIRRAASLVDRLIVCVAAQGRKTLFDLDERLALLEMLVAGMDGVEVEPFEGLLVAHARARGASMLVRSMRGAHDYDVEVQMAFANKDLEPDLETVFLAPSAEHARISGTLVREVAAFGGDVSRWVAPAVAEALRRKHGDA